MSLVGGAAETVPFLILAYAVYIGKNFYANLYPTFPEFDANHNYVQKFSNRIAVNETLSVKVFVKEGKSQPTIAKDAKPVWTFKTNYDWDEFIPRSSFVVANTTQQLLESGKK